MNVILSRRSAGIHPSASIAAKALVTTLREQGRDIVDLTLGEPDLDTPAPVLDAAMRAMRDGDTHYTASNGTPALRAAVCEKLFRDNALSYRPSQVVIGCGAKQLIHTAFAATLDEGDEVIVPAPYWVSYPEMAALAGGVPVVVACSEANGFKLTPEDLEEAITPRTRWLVLNSPNNPTGAVYSAAELVALIAVLRRHTHVWLMTDEIYEHLVYDGVRAASAAALDEEICARCLTVNGVSKAYAMTGWRVGYAAGPADLIAAITKLVAQSTTCTSSVSQAAAAAALTGDQSFVRDAAALYGSRRDRMMECLAGIEGFGCRKPQGAFYLFPSVAGLIGRRCADGRVIASDQDIEHYLIEAAGVVGLAGSAYGLSPYLRLSFATSLETIECGCERIAAACAALSPATGPVS